MSLLQPKEIGSVGRIAGVGEEEGLILSETVRNCQKCPLALCWRLFHFIDSVGLLDSSPSTLFLSAGIAR